MSLPLGSNCKYKCHCHCSWVTESTGTVAWLLICSAGSQMSDVHHRHHTFSTTYLNSPCGRLSVPTGVPRKFIPLPREHRNLQSRSRLYRGIFLHFNTDPAGNPAGLPRDIPAPALPCKTLLRSTLERISEHARANFFIYSMLYLCFYNFLLTIIVDTSKGNFGLKMLVYYSKCESLNSSARLTRRCKG